jgi:hypothetical protein
VKIKSLTVAIILALACAMVASNQTRHPQRKSVEPSPTPKPAETEDRIARKQFSAEAQTLSKLPTPDREKLAQTIKLLGGSIRDVQIAGFGKYFLSYSEDGAAYARRNLEQSVSECLRLLPEGMTKRALRDSLQALFDAWALTELARHGGGSMALMDATLDPILDRWHLEAKPADVLSGEVLEIDGTLIKLVVRLFDASSRPPQAPANPSPQTPTRLSTLSIEAGLIYSNDDVKPVARTTFYLLDEDLLVILKSIGIGGVGGSPIVLGSALDFKRAFDKSAYGKIKAAIEPHIVATIITGFDGKAKFEALEPGTRFVYGEFRSGQSLVVWNARVVLRAGVNETLTLDNSN